ncbi:hypothetical protein ACFQ1M_16100 [Sungkyunkwania multivorans]|uniref:Peptidase A2 domain-containing protein n=1 Tax=Sungkyunkwania multivorans TaxID=1173618 RepID=A0ABW3D1A4_9FLAO
MKPIYLIVFLFILLSSLCHGSDTLLETDAVSFPKAEYITENTTRLPFKLVDHLIVVEAEIYGKKGNFIIDTGSEGFLFNSVHFKSLSGIHRGRVGAGVNGSIGAVDEKSIHKFTLQDFDIKNRKAQIIDLSHLERSKKARILGIIGFQVLKDFEVFIDFYLKQITLFKLDKAGERIDAYMLLEKVNDSIDFKLKKHSIIVECFVNGERLKFALDTGAEVNQLNKSVSEKVLEKFRPIRRIMMTGMHRRKIEVLAGKLYEAKLKEGLPCGMMRTIVTDLRKMNEAYGTKLDGVLGYDFIAMRRIIINYKKKKLYFVKLPYN